MSQKMTNFVIPIKDISIDMSSVNGVMLDFSGGPDSALLGYMLAGYKNKLNSGLHLKFVNWQAKDLDEYLTPRVEKIIQWIRSEHDNVEIDLEIFQMDRSLIQPGVDWKTLSMDVIDDYEDALINEHYDKAKSQGVYTHKATAQNVHMPEELADELYGNRWHHGWRPERDYSKHVDKPVLSPGSLKPFNNLFKTDLFDIASHYGIVDTLMELTNSCNRAVTDTTINYHCKECYHCIERHWAYGRY